MEKYLEGAEFSIDEIKIILIRENDFLAINTIKKEIGFELVSERNTIEKMVLDAAPGNELNKYFLAQVFQGKVKAPTFFTSKSELEDFVARTPGAIGVSQNTTLSGSEIKLVVVDGKKQL